MTREEELKKQQRDSLAKEVFVMLVATQEDPHDTLARKAFDAADTFWKVANEMTGAPPEPKKMTGAG